MKFDPADVDAIKRLARDHCKEMIDGGKSGPFGAEKYLSNRYLDSLDADTREKFLSVYDSESKLYYQERTESDRIKHLKEEEELQANHEILLAKLKRTSSIANAFMYIGFVIIAVVVAFVVSRR